jgi:hypothetical protein
MSNSQLESQKKQKTDHLEVTSENQVTFEFLKKMVVENSNDFILGGKVRKVIYDLLDKK